MERAAKRGIAGWEFARRHSPRSRAIALGVIIGLLAAVTVLRWFFDGEGQAMALLYVIPITLGALRFGRRGGIAIAGFGMIAFIVLEALRPQGDLDMSGWVGPLLAMALIGVLVGHLSEAVAQREADGKRHARRSRHLEELCDAQRSAIEASESLVQQVAAARWLLEAGQNTKAHAALSETVIQGIAEMSCALPSLPQDPDGHEPPSGADRVGDVPSPN